jgi:hypothetical protein
VHDPKYHDLHARGQWTKKIFFCIFHSFRGSSTYLCYIFLLKMQKKSKIGSPYCAVWRARGHLDPLGQPLQHPGHQAHADHRLSSLANGLVECFHWRLKDALHARLAGPTWNAHLPLVLLGLRSAPREEDNISPAQAVFGTPIVLPGQFLDTSANVNEPEFFY